MHTLVHGHGTAADLLAHEFIPRALGQRIQLFGDLRQRIGRQWQFHRLLANHVLVGQAHAVSRQHASQGMHKHPRHPQRIGHQAGVLATRAAKALQGIARHVIAPCHRYFLDGVGHLLHSDVDKSFCHHLSAAPSLARKRIELGLHRFDTQGLVGTRAKHLGEIARLNFPDHHIGIGHGQRAAPSVAGWAGVGPCTLGAHAKARTVKAQNRAPACRHSVDAHHGRAHAHTSHLGFKFALKLARVVRHVGGGATHVKANHLGMTRQRGGACHAHNATRGTGEDGVLALEGMGIGQSTRRLHKVQRHAGHLTRHLLHIAPQDGREIRVHHGGVAPAHKFHHGAGFVRGAHLGKARLARQCRSLLFMLSKTVAVHEHNGHAAQARGIGRVQRDAQCGPIQLLQYFALCCHPLSGFNHLAVKQLGQHNVAVKQARAVLVGNAQGIAKSLGSDQQGALTLALQQGVGGHGGAHLHALHLGRQHGLTRLEAQQVTDTGHCRVAVLLGVFRQQFVGDQ